MPDDRQHNHSAPVRSWITGPIIAGVVPGQPAAVVERAAGLAAALGTEIICVWVDATSYMRRADDGGEDVPVPIDPDVGGSRTQHAAADLTSVLSGRLEPFAVSWSFQALAGEPAREISRLAAHRDASMIVVGTREPGFGHHVEELLTGSVAVHLAHHQWLPVMVVPLHPKLDSGAWQ